MCRRNWDHVPCFVAIFMRISSWMFGPPRGCIVLIDFRPAARSESPYLHYRSPDFNTLSPRQNGRHFADDIFKCFFLNKNISISIKIPLKFVPKGHINNIPALVRIMAWHRPGDKPLSEPRMESLLTHICVTRPQWVNVESPSRCRRIATTQDQWLLPR